MSKKLLFNNLKAKATCPCCGSVEDECICISLEQLGATELEVDFAIAGKYANITFGGGTTGGSYNGNYWYNVVDSGLNTDKKTLFTEKMTELGRTDANNYSDGTDYYMYWNSYTYDWYLRWNYTLYGTPNITRLNQLMTLTDNQLNQLNTYGKYYVPTYNITYNLAEQVTLSNTNTSIYEGYEYTTTISVAESYKISSVTVLMNGEDITSTVYANEIITIPSVTGNIEITVVAEEVTVYTITYNLTEVTLDNNVTSIMEGLSYTAIVTPTENYEIATISILMNSEDITETVFDSETNTITISNVTNDIEITVVAEEKQESFNVVIDYNQETEPTLPNFMTLTKKSSSSSFGFEHQSYSGGGYGLCSQNYHNSTTYSHGYIAIDTSEMTGDFKVKVTYNISSESASYDYCRLFLTTSSTCSYTDSGYFKNDGGTTNAVTMAVATSGKVSCGGIYYLHFFYRKDSSTNTGYDRFCIRQIEIVEAVDVPLPTNAKDIDYAVAWVMLAHGTSYYSQDMSIYKVTEKSYNSYNGWTIVNVSNNYQYDFVYRMYSNSISSKSNTMYYYNRDYGVEIMLVQPNLDYIGAIIDNYNNGNVTLEELKALANA